MKRRPLKPGDIYPAQVLRDDYGMNVANRPTIKVDTSDVPTGLHDLIPLVERWAIPCDVARTDYFESQSPEDVKQFWFDVLPRREQICEWLNSMNRNGKEWPAAALYFGYFLKAHNEAWQPTEEEKKQRDERFAAHEHRQNLRLAIEAGLAAFTAKDFSAVVQSLTPYTHELDKVVAAKLAYARKKLD